MKIKLLTIAVLFALTTISIYADDHQTPDWTKPKIQEVPKEQVEEYLKKIPAWGASYNKRENK